MAIANISDESKVIRLNTTDENLLEIYKYFIEENSRNSENTSKNYNTWVREFFGIVLGKELEFVTISDIQGIRNVDVQKYISILLDDGRNKETSVKPKLYSVKSFFKALKKNNIDINPSVLETSLKGVTEHHAAMVGIEEVEKFFEHMKCEKEYPTEKYLLSKLLIVTGNRLSATLAMTWGDIVDKIDVETGSAVKVVRVLDKGKKVNLKAISNEFYNELSQGLRNKKDESEKIFTITDSRFRCAVKRFNKKYGTKLKPHSLKASAVTLGFIMEKDINKSKQHGSHASIRTTEIYVRSEDKLKEQLSFKMDKLFERVQESEIDKLSKEELLSIVKSDEYIKQKVLEKIAFNNAKENGDDRYD